MMKNKIKHWLLTGLVGGCMTTTLCTCVDNDQDVPENYYASTKLTALQQNS